jgi:hypothetical protein
VYQLKNTYSLANRIITFTETPPDGRSIEVVIASSVTFEDSEFVNQSGDTMTGKLTIEDNLEFTGETDTGTLVVGDGVAIDAILDEDDMVSDSDTAVPTQQSVKAYVDESLKDFAPTSEAIATNTFTSDGVQTTYTLSREPVNEDNTQVYFGGVYQSKANYSVSGLDITFSEAPPYGDIIEVMILYAVVVDEESKGGSLFKGDNGTVGSPSGLSDIFRVNANSLNTNVTIDAAENASCTGPIAIADGVIVTVGGNLTVI